VNGSALSGVRIIDLTTVIFGPSASQILADYGADVIKVEAPGGDSTRHTGPSAEAGMASLFLGANRNKRSIVVDLKEEAGRQVLMALIDTADVFMHNIRPQKLPGLELTREALCARHPRLIYAGLHGFGEDGPYAGKAAYDDIIQALSGAADLSRRQSGTPRYMPTIVADKVGGQMAAHAILAALYQRERTGRGQFIEIPMFEATVQFLLMEHYNSRHIAKNSLKTNGDDDEGFGYRRTLSPSRKPFRTQDGYVCFMPYSDRDWQKFFHAIGRGDLARDARFTKMSTRARHIEELYQLLETIIAENSTDYWIKMGARLSLACAPVNRLEDLEYDPHLEAVAMFATMPTGGDWDMRFVRSPIKLAESNVSPTIPPRLGEHSEEILAELDLPQEVRNAVLSV
jgi:crotonobetainyl-CoA:carnitine CoA-transferase CaiB-like acyl-CoA transferase|tara:strand:+ start:4135 stop:5334 length:1200 start_codon:yes stop_codon:yes gene_type:complete